jgi:hypothetical protein
MPSEDRMVAAVVRLTRSMRLSPTPAPDLPCGHDVVAIGFDGHVGGSEESGIGGDVRLPHASGKCSRELSFLAAASTTTRLVPSLSHGQSPIGREKPVANTVWAPVVESTLKDLIRPSSAIAEIGDVNVTAGCERQALEEVEEIERTERVGADPGIDPEHGAGTRGSNVIAVVGVGNQQLAGRIDFDSDRCKAIGGPAAG